MSMRRSDHYTSHCTISSPELQLGVSLEVWDFQFSAVYANKRQQNAANMLSLSLRSKYERRFAPSILHVS